MPFPLVSCVPRQTQIVRERGKHSPTIEYDSIKSNSYWPEIGQRVVATTVRVSFKPPATLHLIWENATSWFIKAIRSDNFFVTEAYRLCKPA